MIRSPLSIRLDPAEPIREQVRRAAEAGAKGVVVEAAEELAPGKLSETGRRELRHLLRSVELKLVGVHLPTRRGFATFDQIEDRLARADRAFALAYDLGTNLVLARAGAIPAKEDGPGCAALATILDELAARADHRGLRLALETGTEPGDVLRAVLDERDRPNLAASVDPAYLLRGGFDPVAAVRDLGPWVAHGYIHQAVDQRHGAGFAGRSNTRSSSHLDWAEYFGALEEINYRGPITIWPESPAGLFDRFRAIAESLRFA